MKQRLIYLFIFIVLLNSACKENTVGPPPLHDNSFRFKVSVKDASNQPVPGLQIKVRFRSSISSLTQWDVPYLWKIYCVAKSISGDSTYLRDSTYIIHDTFGELETDVVGYTGIDGSFECKDSLLFPIAITQLDHDTLTYRDENNTLLGLMVINKACSIMVITKDTLTKKQNTHYELLMRGNNEYKYTWAPMEKNNASIEPSRLKFPDKAIHRFVDGGSGTFSWGNLLSNASVRKDTSIPIPSEWNSLTFTDHYGNSQTLYYGPPDTIDLNRYELPPLPPEALFDVRFASNRIIELANDTAISEFSINLRSSSSGYPIQVSWSIQPSNMISAFLKINSTEQQLFQPSGSTRISSRPSQLKLKLLPPGWGPYIPSSWELGNCYPNPTNGMTKFEVSLSSPAHVSITVFNLRREQAAIIVNEVLNPGYRSVALRTDDLIIKKCY